MTIRDDRPGTATQATDQRPARWSSTRVVLAAVAVGAGSALVLTLGVFPGATEAVVTGSLVFGFGLGWAVLALLAAHRSGRPQTWAWTPAAAMTTTGAALIVFSPRDAVLTGLTWVWVPLMLGLVAWMHVQARRSLPGRARWLLAPVLVALALTAVGAGVQNVTTRVVAGRYPAPGATYSIGDHRLHLDCRGSGGPTVVLFNGIGEFSASWARITNAVQGTARVCGYDRAGQAWSDDVEHPQDGIAAAADLRALLSAAGEHGPYVLVGHSIGGPYALTYAARYPQDVAGMVLLDSSSPRQFTEIPSYRSQYALMRRGLAFLPTLARIGLGPAIAPASHLPGRDGELTHAMNAAVRAQRNTRDDISMVPDILEQSRALTTLGDHPLVVLTASDTLSTRGWAAAQARLAALSTHSSHRTVDSSHPGLLEDPRGAQASAAAIISVTKATRAT